MVRTAQNCPVQCPSNLWAKIRGTCRGCMLLPKLRAEHAQSSFGIIIISSSSSSSSSTCLRLTTCSRLPPCHCMVFVLMLVVVLLTLVVLLMSLPAAASVQHHPRSQHLMTASILIAVWLGGKVRVAALLLQCQLPPPHRFLRRCTVHVATSVEWTALFGATLLGIMVRVWQLCSPDACVLGP